MTPLRICDFRAFGASVSGLELAGDHGFSHILLEQTDDVANLTSSAGRRDMATLVEIDLSTVALDHTLVERHPSWFSVRYAGAKGAIDPRHPDKASGVAIIRSEEAGEEFGQWARQTLDRYLALGAEGFLLRHPHRLPREILTSLRGRVIADTTGLSGPEREILTDVPFTGCLSSLPWWDLRASWLVEEFHALSKIAPVIAPLGLPGRGLAPSTAQSLVTVAAIAGDGILVPAALVTGNDAISVEIDGLNAFLRSGLGPRGTLKALTGPGSPITVLLRAMEGELGRAKDGVVALVNPDGAHLDIRSAAVHAALGDWDIKGGVLGDHPGTLQPLRGRLYRAMRRLPVPASPRDNRQTAIAAAAHGPVVVEAVTPSVDAGRFAVKRIVGDTVQVEADIFADGHPVLAAVLIVTAGDEKKEIAFRPIENDRWAAPLLLENLGQISCIIEAWVDLFATLARDLKRKAEAGQDVQSELADGLSYVRKASRRAPEVLRGSLKELVDGLIALPSSDRIELLLAPETSQLMQRLDERQHKSQSAAFVFSVDRKEAAFGSWYEVFPRSLGTNGRHGSFDDLMKRLPAIAAMGFDVLYLPPIHPVGKTNRKGRNNALGAAPGDPGSVYAIGSEDGGHDAIHPELGTFADFQRLMETARKSGLEIALDFAVQCSPDHPWLRSHRDWFDWRADGSIKYAENPPKRYEDIVNVDFYSAAAVPDLWLALYDVVRFWIDQGVRIFRVDNPHTKPFAFWQWLIRTIRADHADVLFLAEAFTRPKIMYQLAKLGFTQSYTYFTWRNTKAELTTYMTELTAVPVADFFRPHFFANTPDINPYFLQSSGRPGFLIRAALAATLSGLWGIFSGFELCEAAALPGREEYSNSDKYELKARDWTAPGHIISEITELNRIRRNEPALQSHLGLSFLNASNPNVLYFAKKAPHDDARILVAISLNPHAAEETDFEAPLWEWGLGDDKALAIHDLLLDTRATWHGKIQRIRLSPDAPYRIWRALPAMEG